MKYAIALTATCALVAGAPAYAGGKVFYYETYDECMTAGAEAGDWGWFTYACIEQSDGTWFLDWTNARQGRRKQR